MKRIVFLMPYFSLPVDASRGGAIEQLMNVLINENERNKQYEFLVITPYSLNKEYKNTKIISLEENKFVHFFTRAWVFLSSRLHFKYITRFDRRAFKVIKKLDYDALIVEGAIPSNLKKFKKLDKSKLYMHVHFQHDGKIDLGEYFANVISVSDFIDRDLKEKTKNTVNYYVLKNCLTNDNFYKRITKEEKSKLRKELGFSNDDKIVIFCGRLAREKGIDKLIEAISMIEDKKIKLLVIGQSFFKGSKKNAFIKSLENQVANLKERVKFSGYIHNSELYKYYQMCDLQVIPSMYEEAAGLVAIEGNVSNIAQIITDSGGIKEYASSECRVVKRDENLVANLAKMICEEVKVSDKKVNEFTKEKYYQDFAKLFKSE